MNKITLSVAIVAGSFLLGQYSIIKSYDMSVLEENTIQLVDLSYQYGCNKAKYELSSDKVDCKRFATSYKQTIANIIKVQGFTKE